MIRRAFGADKLHACCRFVRVKAANLGVIPEGQPAAGVKAWLFVDESVADWSGINQPDTFLEPAYEKRQATTETS